MTKETTFIIFCMENFKVYKSLTGKDVAQLFDKYGVYDYLRDFYDVLHTMGYQYINHNIDSNLESRNAIIPI